MQAITIDRFGGPEVLKIQEVPVPDTGPNDVLIRVEIAGVGEWDPFEREGGYAEMLGMEPSFPYILGSEGAGVVVAVGEAVEGFEEGDQVYAAGFLNPGGGFYAAYAAVDAEFVSHIPETLTMEEAGVVAGVGLTALRGLDDVLALKSGENVMIFGAGGGVGHVAVQLAKRMGARVFAVASGDDGVALARCLGADSAVNGRDERTVAAFREVTPGNLDAALVTAGGKVTDQFLSALREGSRVAYPNGVHPEPGVKPGIRLMGYNGEPDADIISRLNRLIGPGPFEVHVARTFSLAEAADAHRFLEGHYLGKLALRIQQAPDSAGGSGASQSAS